jgi:hypothetical protein
VDGECVFYWSSTTFLRRRTCGLDEHPIDVTLGRMAVETGWTVILALKTHPLTGKVMVFKIGLRSTRITPEGQW